MLIDKKEKEVKVRNRGKELKKRRMLHPLANNTIQSLPRKTKTQTYNVITWSKSSVLTHAGKKNTCEPFLSAAKAKPNIPATRERK